MSFTISKYYFSSVIFKSNIKFCYEESNVCYLKIANRDTYDKRTNKIHNKRVYDKRTYD